MIDLLALNLIISNYNTSVSIHLLNIQVYIFSKIAGVFAAAEIDVCLPIAGIMKA